MDCTKIQLVQLLYNLAFAAFAWFGIYLLGRLFKL